MTANHIASTMNEKSMISAGIMTISRRGYYSFPCVANSTEQIFKKRDKAFNIQDAS